MRVRIIAPLDLRIRMCRERLKLSESEARAYIAKVDEERRRWTRYLYPVDWQDPGLYDIVLNLERSSIADACEVVAHMARQQACFQFGPECRQSMNDLALACRVKAALALDKETVFLLPGTFDTPACGEPVSLDASKGTLYRDSVRPGRPRAADRWFGKDRQPADPLHRRVLELKLLNPTGAAFPEKSCASLHDAPRYRHEKAVEDFGLQVDRRADLVNAWLKNVEPKVLAERLDILGRLAACTCQLDMFLDSHETTEWYARQFREGNYSFEPPEEADSERAGEKTGGR